MYSPLIYFFLFFGLLLLGIVFYLIQKRIGEDQALDWKEFKQQHPEYFKNKNEKITTNPSGSASVG